MFCALSRCRHRLSLLPQRNPRQTLPPHATIGAVMFCASCVGKEKVALAKSDADSLTGLGIEILQKVRERGRERARECCGGMCVGPIVVD